MWPAFERRRVLRDNVGCHHLQNICLTLNKWNKIMTLLNVGLFSTLKAFRRVTSSWQLGDFRHLPVPWGERNAGTGPWLLAPEDLLPWRHPLNVCDAQLHRPSLSPECSLCSSKRQLHWSTLHHICHGLLFVVYLGINTI